MIRHIFSLTLCMRMVVSAGFADSWPQFRGPGGTGKASNAEPPSEWNETKNVAWKTAIPGRGHSSPVFRDGHVWLTTAIETNTRKKRVGNDPCLVSDHITLKVICLDAKTGKIEKNITLFDHDKPAQIHVLNSYATPTPVVGADRVYCDFGALGTACVETGSGKILWKTSLVIRHDVGPGSSPIIYKNLLIVIRDGINQQYIAALDTATGKTVWKTNRPPLTKVHEKTRKSFSTPTLYQHDGQDRITAPSAQWLTAYDPATGKEIWRANHGKGFSIAAQPSVGNGMVYYCTGYSGTYLRAVRIDGKGDVTKTHLAWNSKRWVPSIPTPLLLGKELYWVTDSGIACCADAISGEVLWHKSLRGAKFRSAPIFAGGNIYFVNIKGKCSIVKPGREFVLLKTNEIAEAEVTATPAFVGRSMFLRTHTHLYHIVNGDAK